MAIRVLDQHTAELIAAGEVVERPASVVKELCENAIDAGANNIDVEISRGGTLLIRVSDDGAGIAPEDIPLAFLRHATSKVRTQADLETIQTLGFRGEALASIASVAQVELLTKTPQDEFASLYRIAGGQEEGLQAAARGVGTTLSVHNLFYNTPARMKFLKKDVSEGGFVTEVVTRLALSHPRIAFRYTREGKQVFATPGDGELKSAAYAVLGAPFARELVLAEGQSGQYAVHGLITPPRAARASRSMQFFFINGRFVKNRTMMAALEQAYRGMLMQGKFPGCVLFLTMPPQLVDVNVHPAKTEVRFARESDVFDAVYKVVKAALLQGAAAHNALTFAPPTPADAADASGEPAKATGSAVPASPALGQTGGAGHAGRIKAYNKMVDALASESSFAPYETSGQTAPARPGPDAAYTPVAPAAEEAPASQQLSFSQQQAQPAAEPLRVVGEVFKTYILAQAGQSLCFIDKHAAHERLIYEQLLAAHAEPAAQQLLAPVSATLSAAEKNALLQNTSSLAAAGIEVEDFGGNTVLVRAVPADVQPDNVEDLVVEVASRLHANRKDTQNQKTEWVLHSVACRAAVKAGDSSNQAELLKLAEDILSEKIPPFCPHGRPVVLEITRKELEKQFGRLG